MKQFLVFLAALTVLSTTSCTTKNNSVTKNLPKMPDGALKKPTSEDGSLNLKSDKLLPLGYTFSAFLWPVNPLNGSLAHLAKVVTIDSRQIDVLTKEFRDLNSRLNRESSLWTTYRCIAETDKAEERKELEDCEKTINEKGAHEACVCIVSNQPLLVAKLQVSIQNRVVLGQKITEAIEADKDNQKNWLLGGTVEGSGVGSKVTISQLEDGLLKSSVRLENFGSLGTFYKSVDVPADAKLDECGLPIEETPSLTGRIIKTNYDIQTKLLTFTLISMVEGDEKGTRYEFVMERGFIPNGSPELTRFKGDLFKKNCAGNTVAVGSAKFDGIWTK